MLMRFNVKNYLSFDEKDDGSSHEFSMIAGNVRNNSDRVYMDDNVKLLKMAAVYGANASGKSNMIKAISFMRETVINGLSIESREQYCRNNEENRDKVSYFEIEIKINNKYYSYGFEVILSKTEIVSEWLVENIPNKDSEIIFERDVNNKTIKIGDSLNDSIHRDRISIYGEDIKDNKNVLFIKVMNEHKKSLYEGDDPIRILRDIYSWLVLKLKIIFPHKYFYGSVYRVNKKKFKKIISLMSEFDTGIADIDIEILAFEEGIEEIHSQEQYNEPILFEDLKREVSLDLNYSNKEVISDFRDDYCYMFRTNKAIYLLDLIDDNNCVQKIKFVHKNSNSLFNINEESDGTKRLLDLMQILITEDENTYLIDEFDRCLHPNLTHKFIEEYLKLATKNNSQLIISTHESRLLKSDLLRRDEIWFIDRDKNGNSEIYSLDEYRERSDKVIEKSYLDGRYGAVPDFNLIFDELGD